MYGETGLLYPYFQSFTQEDHQLNNLTPTSNELEYSLAEGGLFRAPDVSIEEPVLSCDPSFFATSLISGGEDVISPKAIDVAHIRTVQNNSLLTEVFDESKDLLNLSIVESFPGVEVEVSPTQIKEDLNLEEISMNCQDSVYRSNASGWPGSLDSVPPSSVSSPNFLDFQGVGFESAYVMRRAYSEGDMQVSNETTTNIGKNASEERLQKLSRYRKKKCKRNFGRTIKLFCAAQYVLWQS